MNYQRTTNVYLTDIVGHLRKTEWEYLVKMRNGELAKQLKLIGWQER